ncbi:MAG: T9SS type A sorting domain-containing protein [Draconibacterium sp.]|nr:T9SS type A sorting domain-containing protein [Draconibacterium sp.]
MNKFYSLISKSLLILFIILMAFVVHGQEYPKLEVDALDIELDPGEVYQLPNVANYFTDSESEPTTVSIKWITEPGYLGKVDKDGVLTTGHPGEGYLIAKYKDARDSIKLVVTGTPKNDDDDDDEYEEDEYPKVKVIPGSIKVEVGDSVELRAFYINELDEKEDTFFTWSVSPEELGKFPFDTVSMFYAEKIGYGTITATLGDLADTIKLTVIENKHKPKYDNREKQLIIVPGDTVVYAGAGLIQYTATYKLNGNKLDDIEIKWNVSNVDIATIDELTGLLTLTGQTGMVIVSATYNDFKVFVELLVVDPGADLIVNTISIHRVLPNGNELKARTFKEGESYKIGGLPFPLNILNAGMIHFPFGCISEDIVIYMFIPEEYAEIDEDKNEVYFEDEVINGVKFSVKPVGSDEIVEPYKFDKNIVLSLVFKHGLLNSLGVTPENLDVFFASNTGFIKDGSENVVVDTVKNKIYAEIEHFSTIVVRQKSAETIAKEFARNFDELLSVFPNPFNTSTSILYKVAENSKINLTIYNLFGQKIRELVNEDKLEGTHSVVWDGRDENGSLATNGLYFCRIVKNEKETQMKRIIINR